MLIDYIQQGSKDGNVQGKKKKQSVKSYKHTESQGLKPIMYNMWVWFGEQGHLGMASKKFMKKF